MSDHINSWKDGQTIAQKQIQQAVLELGGRAEYPHHWQVFLSSMKKVLSTDTKRPLNILDIFVTADTSHNDKSSSRIPK